MKSIRVYCPVNTSASSITSIIPFERSSRMGHEIGHVFGVRETPTEEIEGKEGREEERKKERKRKRKDEGVLRNLFKNNSTA